MDDVVRMVGYALAQSASITVADDNDGFAAFMEAALLPGIELLDDDDLLALEAEEEDAFSARAGSVLLDTAAVRSSPFQCASVTERLVYTAGLRSRLVDSPAVSHHRIDTARVSSNKL